MGSGSDASQVGKKNHSVDDSKFFHSLAWPLSLSLLQVHCSGSGLNYARVNRHNSFSVDCSRAGNNILYVGVYGPETPCDEVTKETFPPSHPNRIHCHIFFGLFVCRW